MSLQVSHIAKQPAAICRIACEMTCIGCPSAINYQSLNTVVGAARGQNRSKRACSSGVTVLWVQLFSRYPVLNIHATTARQVAKKPSVIAKLTPTLTSEVS